MFSFVASDVCEHLDDDFSRLYGKQKILNAFIFSKIAIYFFNETFYGWKIQINFHDRFACIHRRFSHSSPFL